MAGRFEGRIGRLIELSGERRVGPRRSIYGEIIPLRDRTIRFLGWLLLTLAAIGGVLWLLRRGEPCWGILTDAEFAGNAARFAARVEAERVGCELADVRRLLVFDTFASIVYTVGLGLLLTVWWNASWDAEPGFSRVPGVAFGVIAGGTLATELVENAITLFGVHQPDGDGLALRLAPAISTLAWIKWVLLGILVVATAAVAIAWSIRSVALIYRAVRGSDDVDQTPVVRSWAPDPDQPNFGICLSGGGIRSAAFSLGALSALEETEVAASRPGASAGLLGHADLLASVSGGGYAASAWRLAVGYGRDANADHPLLGDPNRYGGAVTPGVAEAAAAAAETSDRTVGDLFPRLRDRCDYPRNGRGGMLLSAIMVAVLMVWHLALILAFIGVLAWPVGRAIRSWIITTPAAGGGPVGIEYGRLSVPILVLLGVTAAILFLRSFTLRGRLRTILDGVVLGLLGLAGLLFVAVIALPWMVIELIPAIDELLPGGTAANSTLATVLGGGVLASVLRAVRAPLRSQAPYLGGVLLVIGLLWFGLVVASQARSGDGPFALGWPVWFVAAGILLGLLLFTNPDLWSLHWLYRLRLAQTFANRWNPDTGAWEATPTLDQAPLSAYRGAPGPKQVICAVAARGDRANTGIPVVSMTFEPDQVTLHCGPDPAAPESSLSHAIATDDYENLFHGRVKAVRHRTVFTAAALSAAAFAPSLGRHSLGSTNALIAALNLRLGVWMPNPMFRRGRRPGPDLFNMVKEITGTYALDEGNVYVTDGGHWENLALVELVRRRVRNIIAVD
ncbi:MAG: hypothetical protein AAF547_17430, partial [Actinomycetota bacterium]